jgi:4-amino-4-deoxy-L-arabinose transferase-like glycosyltransferase
MLIRERSLHEGARRHGDLYCAARPLYIVTKSRNPAKQEKVEMRSIMVSDRQAAASPAIQPVEELAAWVPENSSADRRVVLLVLLISFAYLCLFRRFTTIDPDEGILLEGAQRILRGQVLYRDFFSLITPGSYYLLALLFKLFGSSIVVARTALSFMGSIFSAITYLLARRVCSRRTAFLITAATTVTCLPFRFMALHNWDSTLWACGALYCAVRLVETPHFIWAFGTGSLASLTFLFEQSKGAGLMLGVGIGLLAIDRFDQRKSFLRGNKIVALVVGLSWSFVVTVAYFGLHKSLAPMFSDWFWPVYHYSLANHVPYGYQNWSESMVHLLFGTGSITKRVVTVLAVSPCFLIPALPIGAAGWLLYKFVWRPTSLQPSCKYYLLINATVAGVLLSVVIARADIVHFIYLEPIFCLPLAWILEGRDIPGRFFNACRPFLGAYVMLTFLILSMPLLLRAVRAPDTLATRRGTVTIPAKDTALPYLQARVKPGETILVYPYLPIYYFLSATFSPGPYDYLQAGMHTNSQFEEMVSRLLSNRVPVVLFEVNFADKIANSWPGTPLGAIAGDPLGTFVLRHYRSCALLKSASNSSFLFMVPNGTSCPAS